MIFWNKTISFRKQKKWTSRLNFPFSNLGPNFTKSGISRRKRKKVNICIKFCIFVLIYVLDFTLNKEFQILRPNLLKKSISGLKQKNRTFACVRDHYYVKLSHNGIFISLLFQVAKTNSFKEKLNLNWNWRILEKLYLEKAFKSTYSRKHRERLFDFVDLRCNIYWKAPPKKGGSFLKIKQEKPLAFSICG